MLEDELLKLFFCVYIVLLYRAVCRWYAIANIHEVNLVLAENHVIRFFNINCILDFWTRRLYCVVQKLEKDITAKFSASCVQNMTAPF
jgi:hypothetical protein